MVCYWVKCSKMLGQILFVDDIVDLICIGSDGLVVLQAFEKLEY